MKNIFYFILLLLLPSALRAQCPDIDACPVSPQEVCDLTPNNVELWNENDWLDTLTQLHDLGEGPVDLSIAATDVCSGTLAIRYLLFLDLDQNGVQETVIDSDSAAAYLPGHVPFDNTGNPGGTLRRFDARPVPAGQQFRFALEITGDGTSQTARLRWNTQADPGAFVTPELPYGTHKIRWIAGNGAGDTDTCEYVFTVRDCKKPTVVCINGLSVNIMPTQMITLWASDFLQYAEDNHTPSGQLTIGIRKAGAGTGFPTDSLGLPLTSVTFDCGEQGARLIELWVRDRFGNADYCETYVLVHDNLGVCQFSNLFDMQVCARKWCTGEPVSGFGIDISGSHPALPPINLFYPDTMPYDSAGCRFISPQQQLPFPANYVITPVKENDPLNGVDVFDLIRISLHILGLEPIASPYGLVAADANKSHSITTFDVIEIRRLLLGTYQEFPNNTSWRFIDGDYVFPNPGNPFAQAFPETKSLVNLNDTTAGEIVFMAIKTGDVDCTALPGLKAAPQPRSATVLRLPDHRLRAGETLDLPVFASEAGNWMGLQFSLTFDPELLSVETMLPGSLPGWDEQSSAQPSAGRLNAVWFDTEPRGASADQALFYLRLKALRDIRISETLRLATGALPARAYSSDPEPRALQLQFFAEAAAGATIGIPAPNPTSGSAALPVQAPENTPVQVSVCDMQGRLCWQADVPASGLPQWLDLPAEAFPAPGIYTWRVIAGANVRSGKIERH